MNMISLRQNLTHNFYQWYEQSAMEDTEDYVRLPETYNYMHLYEVNQIIG